MAKVQTKEERDALFSSAPVSKALMTMAVPTIISQLINLIYNMADTFFVGRVGNPIMIAAVSLSFTLFLFTIPLNGLFGVGGGSYIARLIGLKEYDRVKHVSAFSFYGTMLISFIYALAVFIFMEPLLWVLGASTETIGYAKQYVMIVVVFGTIPTAMSGMLSHILRNVGYSKQSGYGLSGGGILNIILDPLFMFVLMPDGYQVVGAALATALSNMASMIYFIVILKKTQHETGLSLDIRNIRVTGQDAAEIFKVGVPSAITTLLMDFSNMFLNRSMAAHGDLQLAAFGIVGKIERLSNAICLGISMGMLPLVAYNYATKNYQRMKEFIKAATIAGLTISLVSITFYEIFAGGLVRVFISSKGDAQAAAATVAFGISFLRVRCLNAPFTLLNFITTNSFQAMGKGGFALIQAIVRQVVLYMPLIFIFDKLFGQIGLMASYPASELFSSIVAVVMLVGLIRKLKK